MRSQTAATRPTEREGVTKFQSQHAFRALDRRRYEATCRQLSGWRQILRQLEVVGVDPQRYGGIGFGNVSARVGPPSAPLGSRSLLVTCTQTGNRAETTLDDFCVVRRYDYERNWVESFGPCPPSSESMTHAAIYDRSPSIRFVFHGHAPLLWRAREALRLPTTPDEIAYGTREMATAVAQLFAETALIETGVLAMAGHEDGIVAFGRSAEEAGSRLVASIARALIDPRCAVSAR